MLDAALRSGVAERRSVFEVFGRRLPDGRRYGVVAGTGRLLEHLEAFRFGPSELEWLAAEHVVSAAALRWLEGFRFRGSITGFAEGEIYFPNEPVLTVEAAFGEAILLETLVLSTLNHDAAIAGAAARMVAAARGRYLVDMGSRRTHEDAGVAAARAAYLAGFDASSNLEAGRHYGIPTAGTSAHAFTLAHPTERAAFEAQVQAMGSGTTLLVDTYDVETGVRLAVEVCRAQGSPGPGMVRIDSGDLLVETRRIRALLDELGATDTGIVVTGDLDEYAIDRLERAPGGRAPADSYGVGTRLVTGSGAPTAEMIYKLVAVAERPGAKEPLHPVAKRSVAKATIGGRKTVVRHLDREGRAVRDVMTLSGEPSGGVRLGPSTRELQLPLVVDGDLRPVATLEQARVHHRHALAELPALALEAEPGDSAVPVEVARSHP